MSSFTDNPVEGITPETLKKESLNVVLLDNGPLIPLPSNKDPSTKLDNLWTTRKVLGELSELQIKALFPTLTLGLSLVKVFCMLSCDWPRDQQGTSKIKIAASIMIFMVASLYYYFLHPKNTSYFSDLQWVLSLKSIHFWIEKII